MKRRKELTQAERRRRNAEKQRRYRARRAEAFRTAMFERSISEPLSL